VDCFLSLLAKEAHASRANYNEEENKIDDSKALAHQEMVLEALKVIGM